MVLIERVNVIQGKIANCSLKNVAAMASILLRQEKKLTVVLVLVIDLFLLQ